MVKQTCIDSVVFFLNGTHYLALQACGKVVSLVPLGVIICFPESLSFSFLILVGHILSSFLRDGA